MATYSFFKVGELLWLSFLPLVIGQNGKIFRVTFYENYNYKGFIRDLDIGPNDLTSCIEVSRVPDTKSIRTDGCIMLYWAEGCSTKFPGMNHIARSWGSRRVDSDNPEFGPFGYVLQDPIATLVRSLHRCSNELGGGPSVDVDIYTQIWYQGRIDPSYLGVSGCTNLPDYVNLRLGSGSVDNHGHSLDIFKQENCVNEFKFKLMPGDSRESRMYTHGPETYVRSFRQTNYLELVLLDAVIYQSHFENGTSDMLDSATLDDVRLSTDQYFRANGNVQLEQMITITSKVTDTVKIETSGGFSNTHSAKLDASASFSLEIGVPLVAKEKLTASVTVGMEFTRTDSGEITKSLIVTSEETISVTDTVKIPPCTECRVARFLKQLNNFPIRYTSNARMTGMSGRDILTAAQIRAALPPEAVYLRDIDANTVDIAVSGVMTAQIGLSAALISDCKPIPGCTI